MTDPKKLAEEHWEWTKGLLALVAWGMEEEQLLKLVGYLYKTAMVHGYKHGVEGAMVGGLEKSYEQKLKDMGKDSGNKYYQHCPECNNAIGTVDWCPTCKKFREKERGGSQE